ncbi:unnamed protein product [Wickerhamomyces anomalus]
MTTYEVNSGFGLIYTLKALLGKQALGGFFLVLYLGVTSTVSAQLISVSSIISFDVYRNYINPKATNKQLINVSHLGVIFFGLFSAGFSIMLHYVGVDMTWFSYFYSMLNTPGVIPMIFLITWKHQSKAAFIISPILGIIAGLAVWTGTAYALYGSVTIKTTGEQLPCFQSNLISVNDDEDDGSTTKDNNTSEGSLKEKQETTQASNGIESVDLKDGKVMSKYTKLAYGSTIFVTLVTWVVWPLPLYRDYVWSKAFFKGNVVMGFVWLYAALVVIGLFPLYDGRRSLKKVFYGVLGKSDTASQSS